MRKNRFGALVWSVALICFDIYMIYVVFNKALGSSTCEVHIMAGIGGLMVIVFLVSEVYDLIKKIKILKKGNITI